MGRSDFSTGARALASRLSRTASAEPSSPDPLRSPSVTLRSVPTMPTAPTVQALVRGFRSRQHRRPPARPSPVRLRFGLVFASGPSPSASRPAAAFGYRGLVRRTSAPRRTLTSWIETLRGALPAGLLSRSRRRSWDHALPARSRCRPLGSAGFQPAGTRWRRHQPTRSFTARGSQASPRFPRRRRRPARAIRGCY
jgi:hypothetical protein